MPEKFKEFLQIILSASNPSGADSPPDVETVISQAAQLFQVR
jgi:hypothetical protein